MEEIITCLINDKQFYDYNIQLGFYNNKMKCFNYYISKNNFFNLKKKFIDQKYNQKKLLVLKKNNLFKAINLNDNTTNYFKDDFKNHLYVQNKVNHSKLLNYSYLLFKENNYNVINCFDFPNIDSDLEFLNKKIFSYKKSLKNSDVIINFEIINEEFYNINLNFKFDKKIKDDLIENLDNIFKIIYDNTNYEII